MAQNRTLKIIWFSFMVSVLIIQVIAVASAPTGNGSMDFATGSLITAMGLPSMLFALFGVPIFMRKSEAQQAWIVRFAMLESMALFGFVATFGTGQRLFSFAAAGAFWLSMLFVFPSDERFTAWEIRRLGDDEGPTPPG